MQPDEIRNHWTITGRCPQEFILDLATLEIAAQLAEMNSYLKIIADTLHADGMARYGQ